jgi:hypothetical protein
MVAIPQFRRHTGLLTLALTAALAAPARGAAPRDELLRFVPEDVAFCLLVQDLRGHAEALRTSPFVAQFRESPAGTALENSPELKKLAQVQKDLQKHLGVDWEQVRDDILGDALAFAYRPGPPDRQEDEQGLFLLRARSAKALAGLVDRINQAQKESGELKALDEREHQGVRYFRRLERDKVAGRDKPTFYYLRGPVLVLSAQEEMLRAALDLDRSLEAAAEPPVARQLRLLGVDRALLAVWLNPRAFDSHLAAKLAKQTGTPDAAVLETFAVYWKALEGVALTVLLDRDLSFAVAVRARTEALPAPARQFLAAAAQPSELWRGFPDNALVACAVRLDLPALFDGLAEFLPPDKRRGMAGDLDRTFGTPLGKDFVKDVLPSLGPDGGFCLSAPLPGDKGFLPQALVAFKVSPGKGAPPVDQTILTALNAFALVAVVGSNAKQPDRPLSLRTESADKREFKYFAGDKALPPGVQPAFGLSGGYLVVASSPEVFRRFGTAPATPAGGEGPSPLLRVSLKGWRTYLQERRDDLAAFLAENHQLTSEEARRRVDAWVSGLRFLDGVEVSQRTAPGRVTLTLTVRPSQPLKK